MAIDSPVDLPFAPGSTLRRISPFDKLDASRHTSAMSEGMSREQWLKAEGMNSKEPWPTEAEVMADFDMDTQDLQYRADENIDKEWLEKKAAGQLPSYKETLAEVERAAQQQDEIDRAERIQKLSPDAKLLMYEVRKLHDELVQTLSHRRGSDELVKQSQTVVDTWNELRESYESFGRGSLNIGELEMRLGQAKATYESIRGASET